MNNTASDWNTAKIHALPSASQPAPNDEIDLGDLFKLFWRRKVLMIIALLLSMILGFFYVRTLPNLYEAEAKLILESQEENASGLDALSQGLSAEDAELNSQIEVIKSRELIGSVIDELNLSDDREFVAHLRDPSIIGASILWVKSKLGISAESTLPDARDSAIDQLTKNLSATIVPKTHVFKIRLETEDPTKSVEIVNALSAAFVNDQIEAKSASSKKAVIWLKDQVAELGEKLIAAEAKEADFLSQTERSVSEQDLKQSNQNLKIARGRYDSFISSLEQVTGSRVPASDRDVTRMNSILRDIRELEGIVEAQNNDLLQILQLKRESETARNIYTQFANRLNEVEVQEGLHESDVRVLSAAVNRPIATKPKKMLTVLTFGVLGLLASVAYILARKFMDRSYNDPVELQAALGIPVIGAIPSAPVTNRRKLLNYVLKRPSSGIMESIRDLRTSLMSSKNGDRDSSSKLGRTLLFTSSIPAEGKTTSSILLSLNAAALDKKVLLIECDLRRSTFRTYFGPQTKMGLLNCIQQDEGWESAIWSEPRTNADIIFGGASSGKNAGDIFASQDFAQFMDRMRERYDLIVLDSPPVLPVPDARLIANHSDQIVYVVKSGSTPSSTVAAGLRLFDNMNLQIDGLILTQLQKNRGYGTYGYGYGSEYYKN